MKRKETDCAIVLRLVLLCFFLLSAFGFQPARAQIYEQGVKQIIEALAADSLTKAEALIRQTIAFDPLRKSNAVLYQYLGEIHGRQ